MMVLPIWNQRFPPPAPSMTVERVCMRISPEVRKIADDLYANTVENNEVMIVKWTFPDGKFPDLSLERAHRDYELAEKTEAEVERMLATGSLTHEDEMILKILSRYCGYIRKNYLNWWQRFDLNSIYRVIPTLFEKMVSLPIGTSEERVFYLEILKGFPPFVQFLEDKLVAQAARYIRMPKMCCDLVIEALHAVQESLDRANRFAGCKKDTAELVAKVAHLVELVSGDYYDQAPTAIGMGQYPGGAELYEREIDTYISCNEKPEAIQARGYEELAKTEAEMLEIARGLGYEGSFMEVMREIQADPRYLFHSPEEMQEALTGYLDEIRPIIVDCFSRMPKADCGVARTSVEDEQASSWGFYHVPVPGENNRGIYYYSAAELDKRCQIRMKAVVYHELLPGHHYQMNLALEDDTLPDIIHHHYNTAYADGWAEYASGMGRELKLYEPVNDYGRLSWDSFLCCRLIIDTGLNALGWTYGQAREFLLEHTMFTDLEIHTELVRYTCGMPAQALAYKWGSLFFRDMRRRAEVELGDDFDIKRYHEAILAYGAIPLDLLEEHFEWYLEQEKARIENNR